MIIVSGWIRVDPSERDAYVAGCRDVVVAAREADGCIDFHVSADPLERDRVNVYEQWASVAAVEAFRGSGPPDDQRAVILDAQVRQHEISSSVRL